MVIPIVTGGGWGADAVSSLLNHSFLTPINVLISAVMQGLTP
jgi:hypothetical protein